MNDTASSQKTNWIIGLLAANLGVLVVGTGALAFGLLPKVERAIQATERVEARFQSFADEVQPVLSAGAGKAIETITKMDAQSLSETATKGTDSILESATERAKRFLEKDKQKSE